MKRAEVWKNRKVDDWWSVVIWDGEPPTRHLPIPERDDSGDDLTQLDGYGSRNYAKALAWALAAVGLDKPAEHREAP